MADCPITQVIIQPKIEQKLQGLLVITLSEEHVAGNSPVVQRQSIRPSVRPSAAYR